MNGTVIKDIRQPINESLIGSEAQVSKNGSPSECMKLFIGDKSRVTL